MTSKEWFISIVFGTISGVLVVYSIHFSKIPQIILSMAIPVILTYIFFKFKNNNKVLYFIVVNIILFSLTGLYLISIQNYSLEYIIPSLGGLLVAMVYVYGWERTILMRDSSLLIEENKLEESLPYLDKLLELDHKNFYALYNKASVCNEMGKYKESLELADKLLKKNPKDTYTLNLKINSLIKLRRCDEALEIIDGILKKDSKNGIVLANKARALAGQGKYHEAVEYYEDA